MRVILPSLLLLAILSQPGVTAKAQFIQSQMVPLVGDKVDLKAILQVQRGAPAYWSARFGGDSTLTHRKDSLLHIGIANLDQRGRTAYAVIELKTGDKVAAVKLLEDLYAQHPDDYTIAAHLAWGYEFTGKQQQALEVLRKAQSLNRQGNYGSDWIHERILEEKLGAQQYEKVINLDFKDYGHWIIDKQYVFVRNTDSLKVQIAYQLHERTGYMTPPDPVVGQLVLDFADIVAKTESRREAIPFYDYAAMYDPALAKTITSRYDAIKAEQEEVQGTFRWASVVWAVPLLAFFLILFSWLKVMRRQKGEAASRSIDR